MVTNYDGLGQKNGLREGGRDVVEKNAVIGEGGEVIPGGQQNAHMRETSAII